MQTNRLQVITLFLVLCLFFSAWMTAFTFEFSECRSFPNYNMLAKAFASGRLDLENAPATDVSNFRGRHYLYFGPVPALLRLPAVLLLGRGIPTGVMIVVFGAGICVLFALIANRITPPETIVPLSPVRNIFLLTFILNGFTLFMVSLPVFYNEAICAAMFFLLCAVYFSLAACREGGSLNIKNAAAIGLSLALCIGSRFSYVFAAVALGLMLIIFVLKKPRRPSLNRTLVGLGIISACGVAALGLLGWYNHARFGDVFEFGMKYAGSHYREYMNFYGTFRYDHFPYNFWSYFFRIPQIAAQFPFLMLPAYFIIVQSAGPMAYNLINGNELAVSIFCLMPIVLPAFVAMVAAGFRAESRTNGYLLFAVLCLLQVIVLSFSLAAIARYYYDFLPLMMLMAYIGAAWLRSNGCMSNGLIGLLGAISILFSFALPVNAIRFYATYIGYPSPLLKIFF